MSNKSSLASSDVGVHLMQVDDASLSDTDRQGIDFLPIPDTKSDSENARTDSFYLPTDIEYLLYQLARASMEANLWDHLFPRHELQILSMALHTQRTWAQFLESATQSKKKVFLTNHDNDRASTPIASGSRKSMSSTSYKSGSKFGTRTKKGSQLARRKGSRSFKVISQIKKLELPESDTEVVRECLETLLTRVQTVLFDTIIEEVIFPHEKRFDFLPIQESIKQEFGALSVVYDIDPYFTLEDMHELKDERLEGNETKQQSLFVPLLPVPKWNAPSLVVSPSNSKTGTPKSLSSVPSSIRSKRKVQSREIRNLLQDAKVSRKRDRVNILGVSDELKAFLESLDNVFQQIKKCKEHFVPFYKSANKSEVSDSSYLETAENPTDIQTLLANLENSIYFSKSDFQRDIDAMFQTALANSKDDHALVEHIQKLQKLADELMAEVKDEDFAKEHDLLKDMLPQIFPEMHNIRDKDDEMSDQGTDVPSGRAKKRSKKMLTSEQAKETGEGNLADSGKWVGHENQEDAAKRALFYQEDPALTKWKNEVRTYLRVAKKKKEMSGTEGAINTGDSASTEGSQVWESVEADARGGDNGAEKDAVLESEEEKLIKQNKGVTILKSPLVPDPLCELPSVYLFPFHWHVAASNWPNFSLTSELLESEGSNEGVGGFDVPAVFEDSAAGSGTKGQLVRTIIARNRLLMQRAPKYADALLRNAKFPVQAADGAAGGGGSEAGEDATTAYGEEGMNELCRQQPELGADVARAPSGPIDGAVTEQDMAPQSVQSMNSDSIADVALNDKTAVVQETAAERAGEKCESVADFSFSDSSSCPDEARTKNITQVQANIYDAFRTLDQQVAPDLLKQSVALQLLLAGFQSTSDQGLSVLTELASAFIERIGFLMTTFLAMPNSTADMLEMLNRTMLEVYPYGLETIIDLAIARTIKTENHLRTANLNVIQRLATDEAVEKLKHFQEKTSTTENENLEPASTDSVYFYINAPFAKRTKFRRYDRLENSTHSAASHWESDESNHLSHHGTFLPQLQHTSSSNGTSDLTHTMAPMQPTCTLPRQQQQQQHSNLVLSMAPFKTPTYGGTDDQQRVVTHPGMQLKGIQKRYPPHPHVPIQMSGKHSNYLVNQQEPSPKAGNNDSGTTFLTSKNNSNYANQQNTSNLSVNYFPPYVESKTPRQQQPSQLPQSSTISRTQPGYLQNVYSTNLPTHYSTQNYQGKSPHSSPKINVQMPSAVHEKHEYVLTPSILPSTPALYKQEKPSSISMMSPIQKDELAPANQPGNMYQPNSSMSQGAGPERDSGIIDDRKEVRTVRNRRGGHINYNDEYYYNGDGTFEDSIEDKPKRKRRRMSSKSKK